MASNGSKYTAFARHRLNCTWGTQSQSIAGNSSVVVGQLYLQSVDAYGAIYASAVGEAQVTLNGQKQTENATSQVSAYQNKLLLSKAYTVGHNADGTKTFSISASFYVNVTFGGVYYGTVSVGAFNGTLNTIPRKSSLNAIPTFTLPNKPTFSIVRQSSSFTHNVTFWVENRANPTLTNDSHYTYISEVQNVGTSGSIPLTPAQVSNIIKSAFPNGKANASSGKMKLWTRQLTESSPSQQRSMMINLPAKATATGGSINLAEGVEIKGTLKNFNSDSNFSYDLVGQFNNHSITIATGVKSSSWHYYLKKADVDAILAKIPNAKESWGQVRVTSKYNGTAYGGSNQGEKITVKVIENDVKPVLNGTPTFKDSRDVISAITGSDQVALQNCSKIAVTTPSNFATARGGATVKTVSVSHGGVTSSASYVAGGQTITLDYPTSISESNLVITVTDSRGYTVSYTVNVPIYPYDVPKVSFSATRRNNFLSETDIGLTSTWSPITIGGINKNTVQKVTVEYKQYGTTVWGAPENVPYVVSGNNIKNNATTVVLGNEQRWDVRITIQDKISTQTASTIVPAGKPIMFIDTERRSVSFGDLTGQNEARYKPLGAIEIEGEQYHPSGRTGIQMNNSDISGLNGIYFADASDNDGEGLHFIKTGKEISSLNKADYDRMYMRDGGFYVNSDSRPLFKVNDNGYQTTSSLYYYEQNIASNANFKSAYINYSRWGQLVVAAVGFNLLKDEGWKVLTKPPAGFTPSNGGATTLSSQSYRGKTVGLYVANEGFVIVPAIGAGNPNGDTYSGTLVYFTNDNYPV